jgi:hypothetical protein
MKFRILSIVVVLAILLALVPAAAAQGPAGDWVSGIACQNLDDTNDASIKLLFYPEGSGTAALEYDDTIVAGGSKNYYTPSSPPGVPSGFLGSVVIQSSTPLACNVNTQTTGTGTSSSPLRVGTSAGFSDTDAGTTMYAPQVMKGLSGWDSYISVQNTSDSDVTVEVTYKDIAGADVPAATETSTIPGYSNKVFYQDSNAGLTAPFIGAATVMATSPTTTKLAVTVNFYNDGSESGKSQLHSYNGFAMGSDTLLVPRVVRRFYGYNGGMSIQNVGTVPTSVTIVFTYGADAYTYSSPSIAPGAALPLYAPNIAELNPVDAKPINERFGSALITADAAGAEIVAIINEDNRGNAEDNDGNPVPAERVGQGSTYNAINNGSQTADVFFAQVAKNAGLVWSGGFQIANTTGGAGSCVATFTGIADTLTIPLDAYGSASVYAPNIKLPDDTPLLPDGFNAAVSVACDVDIVGISNLAVNPGSGKLGDSFTQGNGLNQ